MGMFKKVSILASSISLSCLAVAGLFSSLGTGAVETKAAEGDYYVKVTEDRADWSGSYLIVYESGSAYYALDGSLSKIDAASNYKTISVTDGQIAWSTDLDAIDFTISSMTGGYSILSSAGSYIYHTGSKNTLDTSETAQANTLAYDATNECSLIQNGSYTLYFNSDSGQTRFRFYKNAQKSIQLYKLVSASTPVEEFGTLSSIELSAAPTNTSFSQGGTFDWSGLKVNAFDTNGVAKVLTNTSTGLVVSPADGSTADTIVESASATITYTEGDVTCTIENAFTYSVVEKINYVRLTPDNLSLVSSLDDWYLGYETETGLIAASGYDGKKLSSSADSSDWTVYKVTLNSDGATFTISSGTNYLTWDDSANFSSSNTTSTAAKAQWKFSTSSSYTGYIVNNSDTNRTIAYNNSSSIFGPYTCSNASGTGYQVAGLYKVDRPTIAVESVTIDQTDISIDRGNSVSLTATVLPADATYKNIAWTTSDPSIATVSSSGVVFGVSAGEVTITATSVADSNLSDSITVTVNDIVISPLDFTMLPSHMDDSWSSSAQTKPLPNGMEIEYANVNKNTYNGYDQIRVYGNSTTTGYIANTNALYNLKSITFVKSPSGSYNDPVVTVGETMAGNEDLPLDKVTVDANTFRYDAAGLGGYFKIAASGATCYFHAIVLEFEDTNVESARTWASDFNELIGAECADLAVTQGSWDIVSGLYAELTDDAKLALQSETNQSLEITDIQKAILKYNYIVQKYGYDNFIGRTDVMSGAPMMNDFTNHIEPETVIAIVLLGLTLAGAAGLIVYRRKRA